MQARRQRLWVSSRRVRRRASERQGRSPGLRGTRRPGWRGRPPRGPAQTAVASSAARRSTVPKVWAPSDAASWRRDRSSHQNARCSDIARSSALSQIPSPENSANLLRPGQPRRSDRAKSSTTLSARRAKASASSSLVSVISGRFLLVVPAQAHGRPHVEALLGSERVAVGGVSRFQGQERADQLVDDRRVEEGERRCRRGVDDDARAQRSRRGCLAGGRLAAGG